MVIRIAAASADLVEGAGQRHFRTGVETGLLLIDGRRFCFDAGYERVADWHLIRRVTASDRHAHIQRPVDVAETDGAFLGLGGRVWKIAFQVGERLNVGICTCRRFLTKIARQDVTTRAKVV